jgi:hypothetical protein
MEKVKIIDAFKSQKLIFKILEIVFLIDVLIKVIFFIQKNIFDVIFFLGGVKQDSVDFWLTAVLLIIIIIFVFILFDKLWLKGVCILGVIAINLYMIFTLIYGSTNPKCFYINSPKGSNTLIVEENAWSLGSWCDFYSEKGSFFARDLDKSIDTENGYRPFTKGDYKVTWESESKINIQYGTGQDGTVKTEVIQLD